LAPPAVVESVPEPTTTWPPEIVSVPLLVVATAPLSKRAARLAEWPTSSRPELIVTVPDAPELDPIRSQPPPAFVWPAAITKASVPPLRVMVPLWPSTPT
jgi:hypothetical protein